MRFLRAFSAALALLALVATISGCDTTRDKSERAQIFADRSLATRKPVVVKKKFAPITVEQVQLVGKGKDALIVVRLSNSSEDTYAALPINVFAAGQLLNRGPDIPFFANHVPAIGGKTSTVWIFKRGKRVPGGRLSATVGAPNPDLSTGKVLPDLRAENLLITDGGLLGEVTNKSGTPQYSVEIYATTRSKGSYTAAALGRVIKLSSKGTRAFNIPWIGNPKKIEPKATLGPAVLVEKP